MPVTHGSSGSEVRPGDRVLVIYDDPAELASFIGPFIRAGAARGELCIYVADDLSRDEVAAALSNQRSNDPRRASDAFLLIAAQDYAEEGSFDSAGMLEVIRGAVAASRAQEPSGVRIAVEMTWTLRAGVTAAAVADLDALVDAGTAGRPVTGAFMYRRDRFDPAVLRQLLRGHRQIVVRDESLVRLSHVLWTLPGAEIEALVHSADERFAARGEAFFSQGDEAAEIFLLTRGRAQLERVDREGLEIAKLAVVVPPDLLGSGVALGGRTRLSSARALEDSRALAWSTEVVRRLMVAHPSVALSEIEYLVAHRYEEWDDLRMLAGADVEQRLARVLRRLVQTAGRTTPTGGVIELSLSGQDLAQMAITTPYSVSRICARWRRVGVADVRRDRILILDMKNLLLIAGVEGEGDP